MIPALSRTPVTSRTRVSSLALQIATSIFRCIAMEASTAPSKSLHGSLISHAAGSGCVDYEWPLKESVATLRMGFAGPAFACTPQDSSTL